MKEQCNYGHLSCLEKKYIRRLKLQIYDTTHFVFRSEMIAFVVHIRFNPVGLTISKYLYIVYTLTFVVSFRHLDVYTPKV